MSNRITANGESAPQSPQLADYMGGGEVFPGVVPGLPRRPAPRGRPRRPSRGGPPRACGPARSAGAAAATRPRHRLGYRRHLASPLVRRERASIPQLPAVVGLRVGAIPARVALSRPEREGAAEGVAGGAQRFRVQTPPFQPAGIGRLPPQTACLLAKYLGHRVTN